MEMLMILTYAAICFCVFRFLKVPLNKWTFTTAVLIGFLGIGFVLLMMNYNHPYTKQARFYFYSTPIIPYVRGEVIDVPVQPNSPVKKGDILFKIDPRPYEFAVKSKTAALAEAEQGVKQLQAAYNAALADVKESAAQRDRAKKSFERYESANRKGSSQPFSEAQIDTRRQTYLAADANVSASQARADQAKLALESLIGGTNTTVARLQADLQDAQYDLDQTTVRAPTDGFVTQLFLRPGMMAAPLPLRPVMVFLDDQNTTFAASFAQNALQRIRVGDEAEIIFTAVPGRVFKGKVNRIVNALSQGELQPTGALVDPETRMADGRVSAVIDITDDISNYQLPPGSSGEVALYTEHWHHFAMIRRILLRMKSWQNYVFLEGH